MQAVYNRSSGWRFDAYRGVSNGHTAVIPDSNPAFAAPDIGPPGVWFGLAHHGAILSNRLIPGHLSGHIEFAVNFVFVPVKPEAGNGLVGCEQIIGFFGGKVGWQSFLPVLVLSFYLSFRLGCGGIAE